MRIIKRDGGLQPLEISKIQRAMLMAFASSGGEMPDTGPLVGRVVSRLATKDAGDLPVDAVSKAIEAELCSSGFGSVAAAFIRHRLKRDAARAVRRVPDPAMLGDYIHVSKYARHGDGRREVFSETVNRVAAMHSLRWPHLDAEIGEAFEYVHDKKVLPSMRSMQFGGAAIEQNNARMYNCSFTHVDRWRVFQETFFLLLSGCGVGYSVQWQHVDCLSEVGDPSGPVVHHVIEDTIEGWADAVGVLIGGYRGGYHAEFSYHLIRPEGTPLVTSGGKAPGHLGLKRCLETLRGMLDAAVGRKLRPIECHDMLCVIAEAVLAGGIRRSSLISLFSLDDTEMLYAKAKGNFRYASGADPGLNAHREMANNSCALLRGGFSEADLARVQRVARENFGCPGFAFVADLDYGTNPCGEIGLYPVIGECCGYGNYLDDFCACGRAYVRRTGFSFCNLVEINGAAVETADDLIAAAKAAAAIGTMQAAYTSFPYLGPVTEAIARREALLGVGLTGIQDSAVCRDPEALQAAAAAAVATNVAWAERLGIAQAARVTTVKPSGTASLVLGCGAGIHPRYARRYFRRANANPMEPAARHFRDLNPHMVDVKPNGQWSICFPVQVSDDAILVEDLTASEFVDCIQLVYQNWILPGTALPESAPGLTHNVSCTVTLGDGEAVDVWPLRGEVCAMSFVDVFLDKNVPFIPHQRVYDEARWNNMIEMYRPVDWSLFAEQTDSTSLRQTVACGPAGCEV